MKKVLFTDLDGTLLKNDRSISTESRDAIKRLLDAGHYLVLSTGRPIKSGMYIMRQLGLTMPGCYMSAFNGAVIYDCAADCILDEQTMAIEQVEYLFEEAERYGIHVHTYSDAHLLAQKFDDELEYYIKVTGMPYKVVKNIFYALVKEPCKVMLVSLVDHEKLERFQADHLDWEKGKCTSFFSCEEFLEYCPQGMDKGRGVRYLRDFLNVEKAQTYAVGDERNDIPMFREAGIGIAVKNAHEDARKAADYVTENDNEHGAVVEVIEKFILQDAETRP